MRKHNARSGNACAIGDEKAGFGNNVFTRCDLSFYNWILAVLRSAAFTKALSGSSLFPWRRKWTSASLVSVMGSVAKVWDIAEHSIVVVVHAAWTCTDKGAGRHPLVYRFGVMLSML
jgi:hypothetical protein